MTRLSLWLESLIYVIFLSAIESKFIDDCNLLLQTNNEFGDVCNDHPFIGHNASTKDVIDCVAGLQLKIQRICSWTRILNIGTVNHCVSEEARTLSCCAKKFQCAENWRQISYAYPLHAVDFLEDTEGYLKNLTVFDKYKSCRKIKGLDASACNKDCESYQNSRLAQECKIRGGLFKCCIRRDKANCHECRYCCALPFCSWKSHGENIDATEDMMMRLVDEEDRKKALSNPQAINSQASNLIYSLKATSVFYKNKDQRCLKPDLSKPPEKWGHYVPHQFVEALDQYDMSQTETVEYDNNFFNFDDPEVFEAFTNDSYEETWKETYGFDYVKKQRHSSYSAILDCTKQCMKKEKSKFAKNCRRKGGLFKCCIDSFSLETFEKTRNLLKEKKLIRGETTNICGHSGTRRNCMICTATFFCSIIVGGGIVKTEYMSEIPNTAGGIVLVDDNIRFPKFYEKDDYPFKRLGLRLTFCRKLDFCETFQGRLVAEQFMLAHDWGTFCNISVYPLMTDKMGLNNQAVSSPDWVREECMRKKSNVRICPAEILEAEDDYRLTETNNELLSYKKRLKDKKKRKKKRKNSKG